jgi:hypothetical protein
MTATVQQHSGAVRLSAKQILVPVAMLGISGAMLRFAAHSGATLARPVGYRVYEVGIVTAAIGILSIGAWQSVKARGLSPALLMAVAAGTAFWQETYGDWGSYALYSDRFATYDWGHTAWTAPVQCWWFVAGYIVFYSTLFQSLIVTVGFVRRKWPRRNEYLIAAGLSLPIFYLFDLVFEGTTTGLGYWNYEYVFGPAMHVGNGTFPLLWPIVEQVPFMAIAAFALTWRNDRGEGVFDVVARRALGGAPGHIAVLASWIVLVNLMFLTTTILPLMALRAFAGPAIASVP